jgi:hypothetical protein
MIIEGRRKKEEARKEEGGRRKEGSFYGELENRKTTLSFVYCFRLPLSPDG